MPWVTQLLFQSPPVNIISGGGTQDYNDQTSSPFNLGGHEHVVLNMMALSRWKDEERSMCATATCKGGI